MKTKTSIFLLAVLFVAVVAQRDFRKCKKQDGTFPKLGTFCKGYYRCSKWTPTEETCPDDQHFNAIKGYCDWAEIYPCFEISKKECLEKNGKYVIPGTGCKKYYKCCNGNPTVKHCSSDEAFDPVTQRCERPKRYTCFERTSSTGYSLSESTSKQYPSTSTTTSNKTTNKTTTSDKTTYKTTTSDETTYKTTTTDKTTYESTTPDETTYKTTSSGKTTYETTMSDKTTYKTTTPDETTYETTTPDRTTHESSTPYETTYKTTSSGKTTYEPTTSDETTYKTTTPDDTTYETTTPDRTTYETTIPYATTYETTIPYETTYETTIPYETTYETTTPDERTYETTTPDYLSSTSINWSLSLSTRSEVVSLPPDEEDIWCPEAEGHFPHPSNEHKFVACSNYIPYVFDCQPGLIYKDELRKCDYE